MHDIRDENKHLRSQLGGFSEQVVAREHDFEELQKLSVEQSKQERAIWEEEMRQAVELVQTQLNELQTRYQTLQLRGTHCQVSIGDEDDSDLQSERDLVLFSATTSIDSDMQAQQQGRRGPVPLAPLTTPTTPTLLLRQDAHWPMAMLGAEVDPLKERLEALHAAQGRAVEV